MFLDPFTFTPPSPAVLTRAVESYQRVAAARFCRYARDAMNPDLLPRRCSGESLEPTPKQLHAEVRALRHLTAIQRTLRDIGGPLFDPNSPISPEERFRLVDRRLDAIDEALGAPSACSASSSSDLTSSDFSSDDRLRRLRPLRLENASLSDFSSADSASRSLCVESSSSSDFPSSSSADKPSFYHPPEIEDLLEAVNFAQHVFAARAELLDKRRLELSPEDFLLEIASLRDLTAIVRTLRRMSAHRLPEDASLDEFRHELATESEAPPADSCTSPASSHPSHTSHRSHVAADSFPSEIANPQAEIPNSLPPHAPAGVSPSEISDLKSAIPSSARPSSSESVSSVKSVDHASSGSPSPPLRPRLRLEPSSLRSVPRVPEVRPAVPSPSAFRNPQSEILSPSPQSADRRSPKSSSSSLFQEDDPGPWGNWETPPPEAIDESSPEFLADMKQFGYVAAWRRAADRLRDRPPSCGESSPSPEMILNDSDPPPD